MFELRHNSPAWHGQMSVQDNPCSKQTQPLEQTALPLQVQIRSCEKLDDIWPWDCDVDVSVTGARRLVIKLYDSRGKIKAEDENLNKLRTRLDTTTWTDCFTFTSANKILWKVRWHLTLKVDGKEWSMSFSQLNL
jgi:hypothetical protein